MKVTILKTGEELEVNESFGARLIEQGQAVVAKKTAKAVQQTAPAEEKGNAKKKG